MYGGGKEKCPKKEIFFVVGIRPFFTKCTFTDTAPNAPNAPFLLSFFALGNRTRDFQLTM